MCFTYICTKRDRLNISTYMKNIVQTIWSISGFSVYFFFINDIYILLFNFKI